ncbi:MAG: heme-binding protein [Isosphaeraceae bacterium]
MYAKILTGLGLAFALAGVARADDPKAADDLKAKFGPSKPVEPKAADSDSPLPEDFPPATAPGAIEVKKFPAYRSAVARNPKASSATSDMLFWPLFNHISKSNIEMTAPVINSYPEEMVTKPGGQGEVSMEFLYRSTRQGEAGPGVGNVEVKDHPASEYLCLGVQGQMTASRMRDGMAALKAWLDEHKGEWVEDTDRPARRLGYHGPMTAVERRLWEVQLPIKPAKAEKESAADPAK